jgi:hypothetical protein
MVTQWRTLDEFLCPVKLWASIVQRIRSYKRTNKITPVSLTWKGKKSLVSLLT